MEFMECLTSVSIFDARLLPLLLIAWPVLFCFSFFYDIPGGMPIP
jgi:hypothetical protein